MNELKPLATHHDDMVLDMAYDFYGRYLATASADQHVKVFQFNKDTSNWEPNDSWRAHDSSVIKVDFAHPQYGHLLLSASYDRTLKIWEEKFDEPLNSNKRWIKLKTIADAHGPLYDACFLPSWLGLKIASIGNDGILRIYESNDPSDLSNWFLIDELQVLNTPVASHLQSDFNIQWCPSRFGVEKFIVSALDKAYIYYRDESDNKFNLGVTLPDHNGLIRSLAWAPPMGKSYHLIATACKDGFVRIYKIEEFKSDLGISFQINLLNSFNDHIGEVWRVRWNLTGSILSSCGDDGFIRLYKANYANKFQCMSVISADK